MPETFAVIWTRSAVRDLDEILEYAAEERSAGFAVELYEKLRRRIELLTTMPHRGRHVSELREIGLTEYRELIEKPYRLVFRISGDTVAILAVLDSRRDLEELLIQRAIEE